MVSGKGLASTRGVTAIFGKLLRRQAVQAGFDDAYLKRIRGGDVKTMAHFKAHFDKLLRIKLWSRFEPEDVERFVGDVLELALQSICAGCVANPERLPRHVLNICNKLTFGQPGLPSQREHSSTVAGARSCQSSALKGSAGS